ncbi:MAG TPA: sulfatase-like hydrolase/transferase [Chitinophagaceae bacterium]|nr:sulfatase-like hydrolase/transferase [Chitinophagaceae bacterium]
MLIILLVQVHFVKAQSQRAKPNIIYIMADDLGYADLSGYGRKDYSTPNLDKLAKQGMKFMHAYAAAPLCTPTRVAFMTGRYPARVPFGLIEPIDWTAKDSLTGMDPDIPSIATRLRSASYETYLLGKWHLGFMPQFSPLRNGFDYFFGFNGGGLDYISHRSPDGMPDLFENYQPVVKDGYMTDLIAQKAIEIINKEHPRPFYLDIRFSAPHWPWQAPGDKAYPDTLDWKKGGSPEKYAAMMTSLDNAVGRIMEALNKAHLANNTIVIFTSDNGGERFSDMGIYRGRKAQLWEGGIRVPAFVRWPGHIKAGSVSDEMVTTLDWTATILSMAAAKPITSFPLDGTDITPVLTGAVKDIPHAMYWRSFQRMDHKAMREGRWKYMRDEKGNEYLFDIVADPSEKNDLKEKEPAVFAGLRSKYAAWEAMMLKPIPL